MERDKGLNGRDIGPFSGTLEKVSKVPTTVEVNALGHGPAATVVEGGPWWPGPVTAEQWTLGLTEPSISGLVVFVKSRGMMEDCWSLTGEE